MCRFSTKPNKPDEQNRPDLKHGYLNKLTNSRLQRTKLDKRIVTYLRLMTNKKHLNIMNQNNEKTELRNDQNKDDTNNRGSTWQDHMRASKSHEQEAKANMTTQ